MNTRLNLVDYQKVWQGVQTAYEAGYCVSEHGLQAVLHRALAEQFAQGRPDQGGLPLQIVVEPTWQLGKDRYLPDLVVLTPQANPAEGGEILAVFELKFIPQGRAKLDDLGKLMRYACAAADANQQTTNLQLELNCKLNPQKGTWQGSWRFAANCSFHFVAVAQSDAKAVWTDSLVQTFPELSQQKHVFYHWFGRVPVLPSLDAAEPKVASRNNDGYDLSGLWDVAQIPRSDLISTL